MQLLLGEVEAGGVDLIELKRKHVVDLRKQVKIDYAEELVGITTARLTVHRTRNSDALKVSTTIPLDTTEDDPLYIKAPPQEFVPGENPTNPLFTTNVCPLPICFAYSSLHTNTPQ